MPIHYLNKHISAEDRSIMIMSIDFFLSHKVEKTDGQLEYLMQELFKKHPNIPFDQYPVLYALVEDFLENLLMVGEGRAFQPKEIVVYNDLVQKCGQLKGKLEKACADYGTGDMVN